MDAHREVHLEVSGEHFISTPINVGMNYFESTDKGPIPGLTESPNWYRRARTALLIGVATTVAVIAPEITKNTAQAYYSSTSKKESLARHHASKRCHSYRDSVDGWTCRKKPVGGISTVCADNNEKQNPCLSLSTYGNSTYRYVFMYDQRSNAFGTRDRRCELVVLINNKNKVSNETPDCIDPYPPTKRKRRSTTEYATLTFLPLFDKI